MSRSGQPKVPGEQPRERGDHGGRPSLVRAGDLAAQDRNLVAQYQDLRVFGYVAAREQRQPAERPDQAATLIPSRSRSTREMTSPG